MDSYQPHRRNNRRSKTILFLLIDEKVKLTVYYEALCPSSEDFIVNHLSKIFENGLISIVDLELSPYGNARISSNGTIVCQHGEWECLLNIVEACVIHAWPSVTDHFPFIYCVERLNQEEKYSEWESCFKILNLDPKPVGDCYSSGLGYKLEVGYADETSTLDPPHEYVPWVVVDGQPLYDDYTNFISYICKAYKGSNVPQACLGLVHPSTSTKGTVCYKDRYDLKSKSKSKSTLSEIISSMVDSWIAMLA